MDKYTVDLDKVLNDFEYSELTEQTETQPATYPYPTHSSKNDGAVKHSINNVFNSLNEYLNTEITERNSYTPYSEKPHQEVSTIPDLKCTNGDLNQIQKIESSPAPATTDSDQSEEEPDWAPKEEKHEVAVILNWASKVDEIDVKVIPKAQEEEVEEKADQVISDREAEVKDIEVNVIPEKLNEVCDSNSKAVGFDNTFEVDEDELNKYLDDLELELDKAVDAEETDTSIIKENGILQYKSEIVDLDNHENSIEINNTVNHENESSNTKVNNSNEKVYDSLVKNDANIIKNDIAVSKNDKVKNTNEIKNKNELAAISKVNNVSDSKVNNVNDSNEHASVSDIAVNKNEIVSTSNVKNINETIPSTIEIAKDNTMSRNEQESVTKIKNTNLPKIQVDQDEVMVEEVPVSDETDSDGVCVADEVKEDTETADVRNEAVEEKMEVSEVNVNSGEDGGSGNSEVDTYETCSENTAEASLRKCGMKDSMEDSITSPSERPNSLDINGHGDGKREINLIGNPGSTPYNNLYVTKEISVDKSKSHNSNYESESSASVSPTFSEASTDSVRSTDSTDSEIEPIKEGADASSAKPKANTEDASSQGLSESNTAGSSTLDANPESGAVNPDEDVYVDIDNISGTSVTSTEPAPQEISENEIWLGKRAPVWIPDSDALNCLHCDMKFTVIKRRHHCRACGLVLCSKCCNLKHRLEYLDSEARVCTKCHDILTRDSNSSSGSEVSPAAGNSPARQSGRPNPNNPMEYCSVVPPLQQVSNTGDTPPSVMVPVGVLKRKGSNKAKHNKSVMFCDGIRPGSDLTNLDNDFNYNETKSSSSSSKKPQSAPKVNRNVPILDSNTKSFIPENESCLPPTVTKCKTDITYTECANNANVVEMLKNEMLTFAMQSNLHVHVRLITMDCCINKQAWCFSTEGMINVGQDEILILLEYIDNEKVVPKDVLYHLSHIYNEAVKGNIGNTVTELGLSMHPTTNFLDSKNHAGFIYIRPTFQCLQKLIIPKEPYLVGILVHRWETPWAKIFPLRLVLRLGAEYRYYPSPIISTRHRDSVFVEIGHTIINLLADFRNFSYTLPNIRGLTIHMEGKNTTVTIPVNRYDQVMKSLSNSSDHILAFGGNFSENTDSHLVCIQDTHGNNENNYTTHAINIQNKPRQVTGASFIVFNGALKSSSGLTAKSSIVEDGLMIQIPPDQMVQVRESLRNMKNHTIQCGCVNAASDETVNIIWGEPDINFNLGVKSCVDEQSLSGVPSIRVHNGKDYVCSSGKRFIRWTEVFLLQNGEENARTQDPVDISKVAESISKATCQALVNYLDLLAKNNSYKIGIRTTLHVENVSYSAGSNGSKLAPLYMNSLDNELIPVLHRITSNNLGDSAIVLELIFRILNV